jgi:uncharacterized protein
LPVQYAMRAEMPKPDSDRWKNFFIFSEMPNELMVAGTAIAQYLKTENELFLTRKSFDGSLSVGGKKYKCLIANRLPAGTQLFDSLWSNEKYDLMLAYCQVLSDTSKLMYEVSIYTDKEGVDCSEIAVSFGGGGHVGAAGFKAEKLPLEL